MRVSSHGGGRFSRAWCPRRTPKLRAEGPALLSAPGIARGTGRKEGACRPNGPTVRRRTVGPSGAMPRLWSAAILRRFSSDERPSSRRNPSRRAAVAVAPCESPDAGPPPPRHVGGTATRCEKRRRIAALQSCGPKAQPFSQPRAPPGVRGERKARAGPTGQRFFGEPLARWAERRTSRSAYPGRRPGLGERLLLRGWPLPERASGVKGLPADFFADS